VVITKLQLTAFVQTVRGVIDTIKEFPQGAPGGILYTAFMQNGYSLEDFQKVMDVACATKEIEKRGDVYFPVTENK